MDFFTAMVGCLILDLGHPKFAVRDRADKILTVLFRSIDIYPAIHRACLSSDHEVADRSRRIMWASIHWPFLKFPSAVAFDFVLRDFHMPDQSAAIAGEVGIYSSDAGAGAVKQIVEKAARAGVRRSLLNEIVAKSLIVDAEAYGRPMAIPKDYR